MTRILVVLLAVTTLSACQPTPVDHANKLVKPALKDPDSAQFRGVFVSGNKLFWHVCGEVNSKNSFGGYTGFQRFMVDGDGKLVSFEQNNSEFPTLWATWCKKEDAYTPES
jgi:hypothetical protein